MKNLIKGSNAIWIIVLLIFTLSLFAVTITLYLYFSTFRADVVRFSWLEKAITIAVSVAGFSSIITSVIIWQESEKKQIGLVTISLFERFREPEFRESRDRAWQIRNRWYLEEGYKERVVESSTKTFEEFKDNFLMQEMRPVRELIEFYTLLSEYKGREDVIKRCRYFHYGYWRHFLYEIAEAHDNYNKLSLQSFGQAYPEKYREYFEGISYVNTLQRMDDLLGLNDLSKNVKFHEFN
ncbi:hypothetical protein GCM10027299_29030 [Larkinella ripae]